MNVTINCDMGEGIGNDAAIMPYIHTANIACGYHAGSQFTMHETVQLCLKFNTFIGAHPSFFDIENFGRTNQQLTSQEIYDLVTIQLQLLKEVTDFYKAKVYHIKPHGALYNLSAKDITTAMAIANAVKDFDSNLVLYGLSNSLSISAAQAIGLQTANEAFADRAYQDDGSLTPRTTANALINDKGQMLKQVMQLVNQQTVTSISGKTISMPTDTICIHGDGIHAVEYSKEIYNALNQ
jgi:5-oxoprolinase (ATP-hydrolysing) subunit A